MTDNERIKIAETALERILGFFPRADAKASVVLGIDIGMLAILALNAPPLREIDSFIALALLIPFILLGCSIGHLYFNAFPQLDGGENSLLYFQEIAKRKEEDFKNEFTELGNDIYLADLLGQVWRNSEILKKKFHHLRCAFYILAISVAPWVISLAIMSALNTTAQNLLSK